MTATAAQQLLGDAAAAEYLGVARGTLCNWRTSGKGPRYRRIGRRPLYRVSDLEAWIESTATTSTADEARRRGRA